MKVTTFWHEIIFPFSCQLHRSWAGVSLLHEASIFFAFCSRTRHLIISYICGTVGDSQGLSLPGGHSCKRDTARKLEKGNRIGCTGHCPHLWNPLLQPIHHSQQSYCLWHKCNQWLCCTGWNGCRGDFHRCGQYPMDLLRWLEYLSVHIKILSIVKCEDLDTSCTQAA